MAANLSLAPFDLSVVSVSGRCLATNGNAGGFHDLGLDFPGQFRARFQELTHVVFALADLFAVVGVPGTSLVDDLVLDTELDDLAFARDALAVQDVEDGFAEGWRYFVLDDFRARRN